MARLAKPWSRKQVRERYLTIDGQQHRLGPDKKDAYRRFRELMARPKTTIVTGTVAEVSERFRDWTEVRASAAGMCPCIFTTAYLSATSHLWA